MDEKRWVLVVEEDDAVRQFVATALSSDPRLRVAATGCCRETVAELASKDFDLALIGCALADGDACALGEALRQRARERGRRIHVIALRGAGGCEECHGLGADQGLTKPFSLESLLETVAAGLQRP